MAIDLGKISITPKGVYNSSIVYEKLDIVSYLGSSYISRINNNTEPINSEGAWQKIAEAGTNAQSFNYKGNVSNYSELPTTGNAQNDAYYNEDDQLWYIYNGISFPSDGEGVNIETVPLADIFDPGISDKSVSPREIYNYFNGVVQSSTETKDFVGTTLTDYPLGYYNGTVLIPDSNRRNTGYINIPNNVTLITISGFTLGFRGVFFDEDGNVTGSFLTNNGDVLVPTGTKKYAFNLNSPAGVVNFNTIKMVYLIEVIENKKIVSPQELEERINLRTVGEHINHYFSQYPNFDSFTSGYIGVNGLIQPDPTNVRKLSPVINISEYSKFSSHMSIVGAYYRITSLSGTLLKSGQLGLDISIPTGAENLQFTIKGSSSQSNLSTDYIDFTKGVDVDYILKKSDIPTLTSQSNQYIQISKANSIGNTTLDQWENFSDGSGSVTLFEDGIKLLDNITVVNNQAKIRSLKFDFGNVFSVYMKVKFLQLNNSYNMDILDGVINGYGETNNTNDDNINKSGFSFAIIHPTLSVRPIFSIVKAIDYDISGNLEIWRIIKPANFVAGFERIWSGNGIPMNAFFDMQVDFEFNSETNTNYYVSITVNGKRLVNKSLMGMNSNYAGHRSLLFQCKGTAEEPSEYIVKNVKLVQADEEKSNLMGYLIQMI